MTVTNKKLNKLINHNALLPYYLIALLPYTKKEQQNA